MTAAAGGSNQTRGVPVRHRSWRPLPPADFRTTPNAQHYRYSPHHIDHGEPEWLLREGCVEVSLSAGNVPTSADHIVSVPAGARADASSVRPDRTEITHLLLLLLVHRSGKHASAVGCAGATPQRLWHAAMWREGQLQAGAERRRASLCKTTLCNRPHRPLTFVKTPDPDGTNPVLARALLSYISEGTLEREKAQRQTDSLPSSQSLSAQRLRSRIGFGAESVEGSGGSGGFT